MFQPKRLYQFLKQENAAHQPSETRISSPLSIPDFMTKTTETGKADYAIVGLSDDRKRVKLTLENAAGEICTIEWDRDAAIRMAGNIQGIAIMAKP